MPSSCAVTPQSRRAKVAQQVGGPDAKFAVFIEKASLEFCAREALNLGQQLAENCFFRTAELVIARSRSA
jgi:hypothetical protein